VPVALRGIANRWPHQIPETPAFRDEPLGAAADPGVSVVARALIEDEPLGFQITLA